MRIHDIRVELEAPLTTPDSNSVTPVSVYVLSHPHCRESNGLASGLFRWLRLQGGEEVAPDAGLAVWFRSRLDCTGTEAQIFPPIAWKEARLNVVVVLCGDHMALDPDWWHALHHLVTKTSAKPTDGPPPSEPPSATLILPVGVSEAVGRLGFLARGHQVIRLPSPSEGRLRAPSASGQPATSRMRALRRAVMEAMLRRLPASSGCTPVAEGGPGANHGTRPEVPAVKVFISHAKADGRIIAERIRDGLAQFSQLQPWFDANDLPAGAPWAETMVGAARSATDGLIAVVSDAYDSRYWCQREAQHAREPRLLDETGRLWGVQPTVALVTTAGGARRPVPALGGVLHLGWRSAGAIGEAGAKTGALATLTVRDAEAEATAEAIEDTVEWWLLEALLARIAERRARDLVDLVRKLPNPADAAGLALLTFTPDPYTLGRLLGAWRRKHATMPSRIGYPGFGLPRSGMERLLEVLQDHGYGDLEVKSCLVPLLSLFEPGALVAHPLVYENGRWVANSPAGDARSLINDKRIALSAGGVDSELAKVGIGVVHIDDLQVRLCRSLLDAGFRLAFGGTFEPTPVRIHGEASPVNLTTRLLQLAQGWAASKSDDQAYSERNDAGVGESDLQSLAEPPLLNYVRWTKSGGPSLADRAQRLGACRFVAVLPPGRSEEDLHLLLKREEVLRDQIRSEADSQIVTPIKAELVGLRAQIESAEFDALTEMRRRSAKECCARVLMGGKIRGYSGWMPGVAEELESSLWAEAPNGVGEPTQWIPTYAQPILLLGGFGGLCGELMPFLNKGGADWPPLPSGTAASETVNDERTERWKRFGEVMRKFRMHLVILADTDPAFPAAQGLINRLTKRTFFDLLAATSPTLALRLVRSVLCG